MANIKEGKGIIQAVVKQEIIDKLDKIADKEITSRSNIVGKIITENIDKYLKKS
jgi:metal-responsive CopG/Arc/MetJ family transcriptional regulator